MLLHANDNEYDKFLFADEYDTVSEVNALCRKYFYNHEFGSMIFVAGNGNRDGAIQGLITPIGLISKYIG